MTDITNLTKELLQEKSKPAMPIAPIHRLMKHYSGLNVTQEAPEELREIFYELTAEMMDMIVNICAMMNRKTITKEMVRSAYNLLKKK